MSDYSNFVIVDLSNGLLKASFLAEAQVLAVKNLQSRLLDPRTWIGASSRYRRGVEDACGEIDVARLPYRQSVIDALQEYKRAGWGIVLRATDGQLAGDRVSEHLGLFDHVLDASPAADRAAAMPAQRYSADGEGRCIHIGDKPWADSSSGVECEHVRPASLDAVRSDKDSGSSSDSSPENARPEKGRSDTESLLQALVSQARLHQWAKNILVFVPLLASHNYANLGLLLDSVLAFLFFGLCASGVYYLNDLFDIEADRQHKSKRYRPIASGQLPVKYAVAGAILLPAVAFSAAALLLPTRFLLVLLAYFLLSNAYTFVLKRVSTADVMVLAVLYTLRVVAGAAAISVVLSSWLLTFSIFVFVSLAYLKRYIEVSKLPPGKGVAPGRGYSREDDEAIFVLGVSNVIASVIILALYINSEEVRAMYANTSVLWALCFLMLYWGNRIWLGARRGKISDDPVVFAVKDRVSQWVGLGFVVIIVLAKYS